MRRGRAERRDVVEVGRGLALRGQQQVLHADHRGQRGCLEHPDELVAGGRQDQAGRLRQHHPARDLGLAHPQHAGGGSLAPVHAEQAAAHDLGHVGGLVEAQRHHGAGERAEVQAPQRKDVEHEDQLKQHRRTAEDPDVAVDHPAQRRHRTGLGQREDQPAGDAEQHGHDRQRERQSRCGQEVRREDLLQESHVSCPPPWSATAGGRFRRSSSPRAAGRIWRAVPGICRRRRTCPRRP